jgi:hypothetical protein
LLSVLQGPALQLQAWQLGPGLGQQQALLVLLLWCLLQVLLESLLAWKQQVQLK